MSNRRKRRLIKDGRREIAGFRSRLVVGGVLILLALLALWLRFFWLQVLQHEEYTTRSQQNRVHLRHLPPARGLIFDRNGVLLAENVPAFRLEVVPERVKDMPAMLARLAQVVPLSDDDISDFLKALKQHRSFQSVPLRFSLSETDIARFAVERWRFPGVDVVPYLTRRYPFGRYFAHLVGYVGRIDANDLDARDRDRYAGTTHIGKLGIERFYEAMLHGEPGYELVEVNADQRPLRVLERHAPVPGTDIYLSIDARIQKVAMDALEDLAGAVVAIDPRNGQVLAMASNPGFDPNLFVNGISQLDYSALMHNPAKPFLDRALRGIYPPGSTMKPFIGLGGLELGLRRPADTIYSSGVYYLPGESRGYRDDDRGGSGWVDLRASIEHSVNTYFYALAHDMGIDRLSAWMARFGFGQPTGIDLIGEGRGVLPSREWKRANFNKPWYPGETVIAGIGQGFWAVTPLQLAHALATLANRGVGHVPRLLLATRAGIDAKPVAVPLQTAPPPVPAEAENWQTVEQGMLGVVYGDRGTARGLGDGFPYQIAGKTGTAERYSRTTDAYDNHADLEALAKRHRALFVAFTPASAPRIAVAVVIDEGAWGGKTAAPIARKVLDAWLATQPAVAASTAGATP
ncbi:MAG TPA: penicillin-binding protein 2 [Rhodanobacteraceae bacterium]|nr:penicillin-binding protein 2 [Rhodanobacteraceae bacterium]